MLIEEFSKAFIPMCAVYDKDPSKALIMAWFTLLKDYEYNDLSMAIEEFMRDDESGFFPVPAKIIKRIEKLSCNVLSPEEAWIRAKEIMNSNNVDAAPYANLDCPVMLRACKAVGWKAFDKTDQLEWARKTFILNYEALSKPSAMARIESGDSNIRGINTEFSNLIDEIFTDD